MENQRFKEALEVAAKEIWIQSMPGFFQFLEGVKMFDPQKVQEFLIQNSFDFFWLDLEHENVLEVLFAFPLWCNN